jgi:hypothetical protein
LAYDHSGRRASRIDLLMGRSAAVWHLLTG